jgi:hypothetical protein
MNQNIPSWLEPHIEGIYMPGYEARIVHPYREDGTQCSHGIGTGAEACGIWRKPNGWYVHCFRCGFAGFFSDGYGDPKQVKAMLERIKAEPQFEAVAQVQLPEDFIKMVSVDSPVPMAAWKWLWDAGLEDADIIRYEIGYSFAYDRVILPCRNYAILQPSGEYTHKLLGWVGREVKYKTKEERKLHGCVKYLTKKSQAVKHLMFMAPSTSDRVVLVEDVLSAIRVNRATGYTAMALLTTFIPRKLMYKLRNKQVTVWLDGDMMAKSIGYATQMNTLGIKASYCVTPKDPKDYNDIDIKSFLNRKEN